MKESSGGWESHYRKHRQPWAGPVHDCPALPKGLKVLEAGCGNGKHLGELLNNDIHITAFDFSENAVNSCKKTLSRPLRGNAAGLLVADCRNLPFRDSVFDTTFYRHITGHMQREERKKSAEECIRVMKEDGLLHFTGFSVEDLRAGKGAGIEKNSYLKGNGIMTHYFTEEEVRELFSGLQEVCVKTVRWKMRIRGTDHTRAEINAVFRKVTQ